MLRRIIKTHGKKWVPAVTAVCIFCVVLGQFIPFFQSKTQAATATWNFSEDNSQYSYDSEKLNVSSADARLNNAATANGASLNLNLRANVESDQAADFSSANKEYLTVPSNASLQTGQQILNWAAGFISIPRAIIIFASPKLPGGTHIIRRNMDWLLSILINIPLKSVTAVNYIRLFQRQLQLGLGIL